MIWIASADCYRVERMCAREDLVNGSIVVCLIEFSRAVQIAGRVHVKALYERAPFGPVNVASVDRVCAMPVSKYLSGPAPFRQNAINETCRSS